LKIHGERNAVSFYSNGKHYIKFYVPVQLLEVVK